MAPISKLLVVFSNKDDYKVESLLIYGYSIYISI